MDEARVNQILAAQTNLPVYLRRTKEVVEADEHAQDLRRASFGRGHLNEDELTVSRGMVLENIARANLELDGVDVEVEGVRLAQGLELQGRYTEASEAHPHQEEKVRLLAVESAVAANDDEFCECPPTAAVVGGEQVEVHPHYEIKKIYSRKHQKVVSLVGCTDCPTLNATPTPPEQLQRILHAHRASALAKKPTEHEAVVIGVKQLTS